MTFVSPSTAIQAREYALVDAQILLQRALNEKYGDPRDQEDPRKEREKFNHQRTELAVLLNRSEKHVKSLFADDSKSSIKDLAEALFVLGYELKLGIIKI